MISLQVRINAPSRSRDKATEILHYVNLRAFILFSDDRVTAPSILEEEIQQVFGADLEVEFTDKNGELVLPAYENKMIINVHDQYKIPLQ